MLAGACKVNITPPIGLPIGGNIREDSLSRGIHDSLYANLLYLKSNNMGLLFIGLDLIGVDLSFTTEIKERISQTTSLVQENICIFATHTHSGPDILGLFQEEMHPLIQEYRENLKNMIVEASINCTKETWNSKLSLSKGKEESLSFNRRLLMKDGSLCMNWESIKPDLIDKPTGPIDPDLFVITIKDENNHIRSMIVNFTLHPAILVGKDWLYSRDFIHELTEKLESKINQDLVVIFANGAEGNINHINVYDMYQTRGFEEAEKIGSVLADEVSKLILKSNQYLDDLQFNSKSTRIKLPRREITKEQVEKAKCILKKSQGKIPPLLDGVPEEIYAREILYLKESHNKFIETEIQVIQLGDYAIVCLPGEFFVEFGLMIKDKSPFKHTLIFGLANDNIGYVPTIEAFDEGGYEIKLARTSQLEPHVGNLVTDKILGMLQQLKSGLSLNH